MVAACWRFVCKAADGTLSFEWQGGETIAITGALLEQIEEGFITNLTGELRMNGTRFSIAQFRLQTLGYDYLRDWLVAKKIEE